MWPGTRGGDQLAELHVACLFPCVPSLACNCTRVSQKDRAWYKTQIDWKYVLTVNSRRFLFSLDLKRTYISSSREHNMMQRNTWTFFPRMVQILTWWAKHLYQYWGYAEKQTKKTFTNIMRWPSFKSKTHTWWAKHCANIVEELRTKQRRLLQQETIFPMIMYTSLRLNMKAATFYKKVLFWCNR